MTADILIHESPALRRWSIEQETQQLAEYFANPPKPATSEGGSDGGEPVATQRGTPEPDPERPQRRSVTASELAIIHELTLSGRAMVLNYVERNGGQRYLAQRNADERTESEPQGSTGG